MLKLLSLCSRIILNTQTWQFGPYILNIFYDNHTLDPVWFSLAPKTCLIQDCVWIVVYMNVLIATLHLKGGVEHLNSLLCARVVNKIRFVAVKFINLLIIRRKKVFWWSVNAKGASTLNSRYHVVIFYYEENIDVILLFVELVCIFVP